MNVNLIAGIVIALFVILIINKSSVKEGFVKYYQQPATGKPDYLGDTSDNFGIYPSNLGNIKDVPLKYIPSRKNLAMSFASIAEADSTKRIDIISSLSGLASYDSTIDALYLSKVISDLVRRLSTSRTYSAGKPYEISVAMYSNGTRRIIFSVDIQDISDTQVSNYVNRVTITGYLTGDIRFYLESAKFLDAADGGTDGVLPYDNSPADKLTEITNELNLVYPWSTTEQQVTPLADIAAKVLANKNAKASEDNFYCFGAQGTGNVVSRDTCLRAGGFTDTPVVDPNVCKYYKANKNYPNERGGIQGSGYCEAPIGTQMTSFSKFADTGVSAPFCYNCKAGAAVNGVAGGLGKCCDDQANNLKEYNLLTPDFAFPGDTLERKEFAGEFSARGLSWGRFGPQKITQNA